MRLLCKRAGGLGLPPVKDARGAEVYPRVLLKHGHNVIGRDHWAALEAQLNPAWLAAILDTDVEALYDDEKITAPVPVQVVAPVAPVEVEVETDKPAPDRMKLADAKAAARDAESLEQLDALAEGEDRKTVLAVIGERRRTLEGE